MSSVAAAEGITGSMACRFERFIANWGSGSFSMITTSTASGRETSGSVRVMWSNDAAKINP